MTKKGGLFATIGLIIAIIILAGMFFLTKKESESLVKPIPTNKDDVAGATKMVDTYVFRTDDPEGQFELSLLELQKTELRETTPGIEEPIISKGTWTTVGDVVSVYFSEINNETLEKEEVLKFKFEDGFPSSVKYESEILDLNFEEAKFTLGSGDNHALVESLHKRLTQIKSLNFKFPDGEKSTYGEATRQAVVAFQKSQGLVPDGVVGIETWLTLRDPTEGIVIPTFEIPEDEKIEGGTALITKPGRTDDGKNIVYFAFDDGPHPLYSQQIIDLFNKHDGQATFFVLGPEVRKYPTETRTMARNGHYIGTHTEDYYTIDKNSLGGFIREADQTEATILEVAGNLFHKDRWISYLQPPYGATDENSRQYASDNGYAVVMWDIDPQDWRQNGAETIAEHVVKNVYPGAVVLMHDGGGDRSQTVEALEIILDELDKNDYVYKNIFHGN